MKIDCLCCWYCEVQLILRLFIFSLKGEKNISLVWLMLLWYLDNNVFLINLGSVLPLSLFVTQKLGYTAAARRFFFYGEIEKLADIAATGFFVPEQTSQSFKPFSWAVTNLCCTCLLVWRFLLRTQCVIQWSRFLLSLPKCFFFLLWRAFNRLNFKTNSLEQVG